MDLLHRLNPFHGKPSSRRSHETSRLSTSLDDPTADHFASHLDSDHVRPPSRTVCTPAPPPTPKTHRTPSILRSLAHHPSLSALKSKSKSGKRRSSSKIRPPLPTPPEITATPNSKTALSPYNENSQNLFHNATPTPTPHVPGHYSEKTFRRNSTLRNCQSVPDDIGSEEGDDLDPQDRSPSRFAQPLTAHPAQLVSSPSKRKPPPKVSPRTLAAATEAEGDHVGSHNESLRVKMSFDVEIESPSQTRRYRSYTKEEASFGSLPRHLSSPPRVTTASVSAGPITSSSRSRPYTAFTISTVQHPHPPPLGSETQALFRPEDFEALPEPEESVDDGLDILVSQEELPVGTPGGKKADLKRGVLLDGSKSEKGAERFFSRDMYKKLPVSLTPTPTSSPSPQRHQSSPPSTTGKLDPRRSASPFEVRLSPMVAKRMSLDAFGTPSPDDREASWDEEERLEDDREQSSDSDVFEKTQLSTIRESPSSHITRGEICVPSRPERSPLRDTGPRLPTRPFQTTDPVKPRLDSHRRHASAPPEDIAKALSHTQNVHALALQNEVGASKDMIFALKEEMEKVSREQTDFHLREMDAERRRFESLACENYQLREALEESRRACGENAEFVQTLEIAHDDMAAKCTTLEEEKAELEKEKSELVFERLEDAKTLVAAQDANAALHKEIEVLREWCKALAEAKNVAEEKIKTDNHEAASTICELKQKLELFESQSKKLQLKLSQKEGFIHELQDKVGTKGYEVDEISIELREVRAENDELKVRLQEVIAEAEITKEERKDWEDERQSLLERLERYQAYDNELSSHSDEVSHQLRESKELVRALTIDLDEYRTSLSKQSAVIVSKDQEIGHLRMDLKDVDDKLANAIGEMTRQNRDAERIRDRLTSEVSDLRSQLQTSETALKAAVIASETSKTHDEDVKSRLSSYLAEIDRLKLVEASLRAEIQEMRRASADEELNKMELSKRVKALESDREMLNVALESKQLELALFRRKSGKGETASTPNGGEKDFRIAASTSKLSGGRQGRMVINNDQSTPVPKRQLSQSQHTHLNNSKSTRRETMIHVSATAPRPRPASMITTSNNSTVLASTTKHNLSTSSTASQIQTTASPTKQIKKSASNSSMSSTTSLTSTSISHYSSINVANSQYKLHVAGGGDGKPGLTRRSSLPVLKGRNVTPRPVSMVDSLIEEDEISM